MLLKSHRPEAGMRQRGAALIVALLVSVIVVSVATSLANDFLVSFRRAENQLDQQQAWNYLLAAEGVARRALLEDIRITTGNARTDSYTDEWGKQALEFPTEQGVIRGSLADLSGRINLLGLAANPTKDRQFSVNQQRFIRLLQVLPLEEPLDIAQAQELANAVFDWVDSNDDERELGGAESYYYSSAEPPGRSPLTPMASVSELRWVRGMSDEIYRALEPFVTVWPKSGSNININTAPMEVLRTLNADKNLAPLDETDAALIMEERQEKLALHDLALFTGNRLTVDNIDTAGLVFSTDYFLLTAETVYLSRLYRLNTVLYRDASQFRIKAVARSQGSL